jgi:3-hydroxyacyl-CoA dehydrogenase
MKDVVVIGAGKIGATVTGLLASTGDYKVTLADRSPEVLDKLDRDERVRIVAADVEDSSKLGSALRRRRRRRTFRSRRSANIAGSISRSTVRTKWSAARSI